MATTGVVSQVIGSTFDAQFPEDQIPDIYNALEIKGMTKAGDLFLVGEVQQHLGGGKVRAVALGSTDGLSRGMACVDTGGPVTVPVGEGVLGRVFTEFQQQLAKCGCLVPAALEDLIEVDPSHQTIGSFLEQPRQPTWIRRVSCVRVFVAYLCSSWSRCSARPAARR